MIKKFGHWEVNENNISWDELKRGSYYVDKNQLLQMNDNLYTILLHISDKTWMNENDIEDFNNAFLFSVKYFQLNINEKILENTLNIQKNIRKDIRISGT